MPPTLSAALPLQASTCDASMTARCGASCLVLACVLYCVAGHSFAWFSLYLQVGISLDETASREDIVALLECFGAEADVDALAKATEGKSALLSGASARTGEFLQHSVFNSYHSETQMLRYLFKLQSRDLSLTTSMISLGSCTMKVRKALVAVVLCETRGDHSHTHTHARSLPQLNATSEMIPVTWPEFGAMHPFAPAEQAQGYAELVDTLSSDLCDITGFAAMSQQPNVTIIIAGCRGACTHNHTKP